MILPPFTSSFLRAVCVRRTPSLIPSKPKPSLSAESLIPWTEFVRYVWALPDGWAMTGDCPQGVSPHQFWARVYRAAARAGGKVGIVLRGERFWVWGEERPREKQKQKQKVNGVSKRSRGWMGELLLKLRSGEPVRLERELTKEERVKLKARAGQRGWRIHIEPQKVSSTIVSVCPAMANTHNCPKDCRQPEFVSVVQWIGEAE